LSASNTVELKVANDGFTAVALVADDDERARLWKLMADYYPPYNYY
jgi:hypothetical protein